MDYNIVVHLISRVFEAFVISQFMKVFFDERRTNKYVYGVSLILFVVLTSIPFLLFYIPLLNLSVYIFSLFFVTLNFKSAWVKKVMATVFICSFALVSDILAATLLGINLTSAVQSIDSDKIYFIDGSMVLFFYIIALVAKNLKNVRKNVPVLGLFWGVTFTIPIFSIFILVVISVLENMSIIIASVIAILFINSLTFYLFDSLSGAYADKLKAKLYEQEREYYQNQCELMRESIKEINSFRHDTENHLSTLSDYIKSHQNDDALDYITTLIGEVGASIAYSNTGNIAFDSIVNYKLRNAKESGIELQVKIAVPIKLNIDTADVVSIIGNLLDNAIEAVQDISVKKINLNIDYNKGRVLVFIENSYDGIVKRDESGEIVSNKYEVERGYGLKNIVKSIDKYNGDLEIKHTETMFTANVLLYVQTE